MMTELRGFLLVVLMLGTVAGIDIAALLKNCRSGQGSWTAGVTGPEICKLVTRMFDGGRIRKNGDQFIKIEGKDRNKRIGNWIKWYLDRRQKLERRQNREKNSV